MIVVFGGTGTIGGAVLRRLSEQDAPVRAAVRSPERAAALSVPDVRTVVADLADPTSLPAALQDVERVFVATPVSEDQVALESALVDAVAAAPKRPHLVKLAALGYDAPAEDRIALTGGHARIVGHARELDVPLTVLAANGFMSNLLGSAATVRGDGVIYGSSGDGGVSWIDPDDVGAVAAHVLLSGGHEGASYDVTGPEALNQDALAERLSAVLDRPVRYVDVPADAYRQNLASFGLPPWLADALGELQQLYRAHRGELVTHEVQKATGRPATTFDDWVGRNRGAFVAT